MYICVMEGIKVKTQLPGVILLKDNTIYLQESSALGMRNSHVDATGGNLVKKLGSNLFFHVSMTYINTKKIKFH